MQTTMLTTLQITGKGPDAEIPLDPSGVTLGRAPVCHIVLDSPRISRKHARIFQDPFGRWVIEDLDSRNGTWIGEQRVTTQAVLPGESVSMGPFNLSLVVPPEHPIEADPSTTADSTIIEDDTADETAILTGAIDQYDPLSGVRLRQLNAIIDRLGDLSNPGELYPEVCRSLARTTQTVAVVVRIPVGDEPLASSPVILASHFGGRAVGAIEATDENLHISRRVIEAVRNTGNAVMATSSRSSEQDLQLTVVDERAPRAVLCSPLGAQTGIIDALYLDIPSGHATGEMLDFVRAVAYQVGFVRKSLLLSEAKADRRALDHQLNLAREIQANLTPTGLAEVKGVDAGLYYKPAMWVGGDYCDMWALDGGRMAFVIGDVSGKGLPAAMVMSSLHAALRTTMSFCTDLAEAMGHLDKHLSNSMLERMFITMFLGVFDPASGKLEYVNAGHILPIVLGADGTAEPLGKPTNPPVGVYVGTFEADEKIIAPDAAVLVVTDGITEAMDPNGEEFGTERLQQTVASTAGKSATEVVTIVNDAAAVFRNDLPQQDDITIFALRNVGVSDEVTQ